MVIKNNSTIVEKYRKQLIAAKKRLGKKKVTYAKRTDLTAKGESVRLGGVERTLTKTFKKNLSRDIKNMKGISEALKKTDKSFNS